MTETIIENEKAQIKLESKTLRRTIPALRVDAPGHEITRVSPDFQLILRKKRRQDFNKTTKKASFDAMAAKISPPLLHKYATTITAESLKRFEGGSKPNLKQAKALEEALEISLIETTTSVGIADATDQQLLGLLNLLEIKEDSFESEYHELIAPYVNQSQQILQDATMNSSIIAATSNWNDIKKWDGAMECRSTDCEGAVRISEASNTRYFFVKTLEQITSWAQMRLQQSKFTDEQQEVFLSNLKEITVDDDGILDFGNQAVDTWAFRGLLLHLLWPGQEKASFKDYQLDTHDFACQGGVFTDIELQTIYETGDREAAKIAHRLNICSDHGKVPQCPSCKATYWNEITLPHIPDHFCYGTLSEFSTKEVIDTLVGSVSRPLPTSFKATDEQGVDHEVYTEGGTIHGMKGKGVETRISDAMNVALSLHGSFQIQNYTFTSHSNKGATIYSAPNTALVGNLARHLKQLKPVLFFLDGDEHPYIAQDKWAGTAAGQILHAFDAAGHMFNTRKTRRVAYSSGDMPDWELNMLELNDEISSAITERFTEKSADGTEQNTLEQFLHAETPLPMVCPPLSRTEYGGGYITKSMQNRHPLISNDTIETLLGHQRFNPSEEAIESLNQLQSTAWCVDFRVMQIAKDVLKTVAKDRILDQFTIAENAEGKLILSLSKQPKLTHNQVFMWKKSWLFAEGQFTGGQDIQTFYHPWSFEWRGRMLTNSTILSPQNDDFARGVLRFAKKEKLDENGWLWLQRHVAALMKGRDLEGTPLLENLMSEWEEVQNLLKQKTWEAYDKAVATPVFAKVIQAIASDPEGTFNIWGKGDVFVAKGEGFQRLSACITFNECCQNGGAGVEVNLPISHDASSSIYQHASALVRDREMAEAVNVLPAGNGPSDVYQQVIDATTRRWAGLNSKGESLNPLVSSKLLNLEEAGILTEALKDRSIAKKPVMTKGYGARKFGIIKSFLTHNGKMNGDMGQWVFVDKTTNAAAEPPTDGDKYDDEKFGWRRSAHPSSILGGVLEHIAPSKHYLLADIIVTEMEASMREILPGMEHLTSCLNDNLLMEKDSKRPVQWMVADGSSIRNIKLKSTNSRKIEPWLSTISSPEEREEAKSNLINQLERFGEGKFVVSGKISLRNLFKELDLRYVASSCDKDLLTCYGPNSDKAGQVPIDLISAVGQWKDLSRQTVYSRREINTNRDAVREKSGLSPNFIHSHDACHMRLVISRLQENGVTDVWSVHDAFGAHPNHLQMLRKAAVETFVVTHTKINPRGTLAELDQVAYKKMVKEMQRTTFELEEVSAPHPEDETRPNSEYLIA
jgi:hypothetical protein